jgi:hypothetical protein
MKKEFNVDIIKEATSGVGVTIAGVLLKNGTVSASSVSGASDPSIAGQYIVFTDPVSGLKSRFGARDTNPVFDRELVLNGFAQDLGSGQGENVGWENVGGGIGS